MKNDISEIPKVKSQRKYGGRAKNRKWTLQQVALCGYLKGIGETSKSVGKRLGVRPEAVRLRWARWGLPKNHIGNGNTAIVPVPLHAALRTKLSEEAKMRDMETDEFVALILKTINNDDMWKAVLDEG